MQLLRLQIGNTQSINYSNLTLKMMYTLKNPIVLFPRKKYAQLQLQLRRCSTTIEGLLAKFTIDEQNHVLQVLNVGDSEYLSRLDISQSRIKNLKSWQTKCGTFKTISDVLEVDGFGIKILEKLCKSIVLNNLTTNASSVSKNRRQYVMPALSKEHLQRYSMAVGLCLGPVGISWAKLSRNNQLENWDYYDFSQVPKKMLPTDTFKLAQTILSEIPKGDIYIFEAPPHLLPTASKQLTLHNQHLELMSMLLALLNTSIEHNFELNPPYVPNCVYYLRSNVSARLFRTLMGTERVSSTEAVSRLLEINVDGGDPLPCGTLKNVEKFKEAYLSKNAVSRELLGQALLLIITFMEICINKNPNSLAVISRSTKKKL